MTNVTIAPDLDTEITGNWTPSTGATLYGTLDEASADDSDFILSGTSPNQDRVKIRLSDPASSMTDPMTVAVRCKASGGTINLAIRLVQNTTTIAEWIEEGIATTWTTVTHELTAPQRASISDFTDLYIELEANPSLFTGLLDTYTNAAFAFSFRKLRTAYAGSAVRMREDGGDTEADIGFDVNGDFDTAAAATLIGANTGYIVKWYDQSGNGVDVTLSTKTKQPIYYPTGMGSLPAMGATTAATRYLTSTALGLTYPATTKTASVFSIATLTANAGGALNNALLSLKDSSTNDYDNAGSGRPQMRSAATQAISAYRYNGAKSVKAVAGYDTPFRWASIFDGSNHKAYVNGSVGTTVVSANNWSTGLTVWVMASADQAPNAGQGWNGHVSEMVFWVADQTANLTGIDAEQSTYWGIA